MRPTNSGPALRKTTLIGLLLVTALGAPAWNL